MKVSKITASGIMALTSVRHDLLSAHYKGEIFCFDKTMPSALIY